MKKLLLGVDGSPSCNKAIKEVGDLAENMNIEVTVITVVEKEVTMQQGASKQSIDNAFKRKKIWEEEARQAAVSCMELLEENASKVEKIIREGNPASIICEEANKGDYDIVVVADFGKNAVQRFFLGSTTERIVRHCSKSVLVVK